MFGNSIKQSITFEITISTHPLDFDLQKHALGILPEGRQCLTQLWPAASSQIKLIVFLLSVHLGRFCPTVKVNKFA